MRMTLDQVKDILALIAATRVELSAVPYEQRVSLIRGLEEAARGGDVNADLLLTGLGEWCDTTRH